MREHALNADEALGFGDLHPDASVTTVGLGIEGGQLLWRQEDAVRVIQLVDQSARCLLVKSCCIDCIDEAGGDNVQNLIEQASTLLALALLKHEAADHQWNKSEAEQQTFSGSRHTV